VLRADEALQREAGQVAFEKRGRDRKGAPGDAGSAGVLPASCGKKPKQAIEKAGSFAPQGLLDRDPRKQTRPRCSARAVAHQMGLWQLDQASDSVQKAWSLKPRLRGNLVNMNRLGIARKEDQGHIRNMRSGWRKITANRDRVEDGKAD